MGEPKGGHELALLDQASQALTAARTLDEIKVIRDKAEAVRKYAQSASLGLDVQNRAAEVKLRAERQAGELLSQLMLRGGDRRSKGHCDRLKLSDLGLTANQSKRWQMQAKVPEEVFQEHIEQTRKEGKELTSAGLMRVARIMYQCSHARQARSKRHADHSPSRSSRKPLTDSAPSDEAASQELTAIVEELCNHHQMLDGILRPLYQGEDIHLEPAERRMIRYLIVETRTLLEKLTAIQE